MLFSKVKKLKQQIYITKCKSFHFFGLDIEIKISFEVGKIGAWNRHCLDREGVEK